MYQVVPSAALRIDAGRPVVTSKDSPLLIAWRRSASRLSARAFVRRVRETSWPPTTHRTSHDGFLLDLLRRTSQSLTSVEVVTPPPEASQATRGTHYARSELPRSAA